MATKLERDKKRLEESLRYHKEKWLTKEAATEYRKRLKNLVGSDKQMAGAMRKLCREFMDEYGIAEIEAINILNCFNISDNVAKYERIRTQTPLILQKDKVMKADDLEEY